jgi:Zn-dependent protease with chaperone function
VRISVYVPFAVSALLAVLTPWLAPRMPPRRAAWALACAAVVTAAGWLGALALLAFTAFAQIPEVAEYGPWSVQVLRAEDPVRVGFAVGCALALLASCVAAVVAGIGRARSLLRARRACRRLPGHGELAVLDDTSPEAFALPGAPGRIVVSRGMLRCLDGTEREALLAHERAHLHHSHHWFQAVWRLAAMVNPLLRPLAGAGGYVLERWADEEAAVSVGDRTVVARAVARAALASSGSRRGIDGLAATGGAVPRRVRALLAPPPRHRLLPLLAGGLLLTVCCASLAEAAADSEEMVETAMRAACAPAHLEVRHWQPPIPPYEASPRPSEHCADRGD